MKIIDESHANNPDCCPWLELNGSISDDLYEELTIFLNYIVQPGKSIKAPADGISTIQVMDALKKSLRTGEEVLVRC